MFKNASIKAKNAVGFKSAPVPLGGKQTFYSSKPPNTHVQVWVKNKFKLINIAPNTIALFKPAGKELVVCMIQILFYKHHILQAGLSLIRRVKTCNAAFTVCV